jgi:hypothetical protein
MAIHLLSLSSIFSFSVSKLKGHIDELLFGRFLLLADHWWPSAGGQ